MSEPQQPQLEQIDRQISAARRQKLAFESRRDFLKFVQFTMPDPEDPDDATRSAFQVARHHAGIANALERVERRKIKRLIVTLPPRHGKSEMVSRRFIPWLVGKHPAENVIFATYNEDFANDFGSDCRSVMTSPQFLQVFPGFEFRQGNISKGKLQTEKGGAAFFVGRGGSITGRGGCVILDDPIKDAVEAQSPTLRETLWNWFTQVLMTRLTTSKAFVVIVQTRWHEDDLVGRLTDPMNPHFNEDEAKKWKLINLPAFAGENDPLKREPGEVLWPQRFDREFLEGQRGLDPRGFASLYQQQPSPEDGDLFRREHIQYYSRKQRPADLKIYATSDHAVGIDKTRHDATVMLISGVDEDDNIYLLDCWWKREPADIVVNAMIQLMQRWKPILWWAERGHITKAIGPFLRKRMLETRTNCSIDEVVPVGNKVQRAQSMVGRVAMGRVFFPKEAPWTQKAIDELLKFPNTRHDDFVDAFDMLGLGLGALRGPGTRQTQVLTPKVGTLAWVKWSSELEQRHRQQAYAGGW